MNKKKIKAARKILESNWDSQGSCNSCGWHGGLYQYDVWDEDIVEALENNKGWLELGCVNKDDEGSGIHRGIKIFIGNEK